MADKVDMKEHPQLESLFEVVDSLAAQMKDKLLMKYFEGETGWDDPKNISKYEIEAIKRICNQEHIDAANFIAMVWNLKGRPGG